MDPGFKRSVYDKAFNVRSNIPDSQINLALKMKRNSFKNIFFNEYRNLKFRQENDLIHLLEKVNIGKKEKMKILTHC